MQASIDDLFAASGKIPLTRSSFLLHVLPPTASLYCMGVLVQLKGTQYYRLALLPIVVWLCWRGAFVDVAGGDPAKIPFNGVLITNTVSMVMRGITWATAKEPYRRHNKSDSESVYTALWNGWDLIFTTRGIGWNWSQGPVPPKSTFETDSRVVFVLWSAAKLAFQALCLDVCVQIARMLSPDTIGTLDGGSLFDHTLPPVLELARAIFAGTLAFCMVYFGLYWGYQFLAIVGVVVFQQTPSQWPPLFDAPWRSTSLSDLWGRRWHQVLRESVVTFGVRPFDHAFGRIGGLLGAFFVSGVIHDIELRSLGKGGNSSVTLGFWVMNGVGVVLERAWKKVTGKRVGGVYGRVWTFGWLALWGIPMVNEWAKVGRFGTRMLPWEPSVALVALVRRWLGGSL